MDGTDRGAGCGCNSPGTGLTQMESFDGSGWLVAGTWVETTLGRIPVEALAEGDLVATLMDRFQPLLALDWQSVEATGDAAPVRVAPGALGNEGPLLLAPGQRVLVAGARAEALTGRPEALVAARDLVDGGDIRRLPLARIDCVRLIFDAGQVVVADGAAVECPGVTLRKAADAERPDGGLALTA